MRALHALWIAGAVSAAFACVDFYYQFPAPAGYGPQFVWLPGGVFRRAQGVFYEAGTLGNVCCFFLVMAAAAAVRAPRPAPVRTLWLAAGTVPLAGALMLSYSRSSVLALSVSLLALLYLERRRARAARVFAAALAVVFAATAIAYAVVPSFVKLYWDRLWGSATYLFTAGGHVLSGRLETWRHLGAFLLENPWHALLGTGYKTLPYSAVTGRPVVADNMYLSMLVETGVVGFLALLFLHAAVLGGTWRAAHSRAARTRFFGAWMFCFWCGQVFQMLSVDLLTFWRVLPLYFWALAWTMRLRRDDPVS
jgi:O-antigen ligase